MAELKKCPFCGGEAELHIGYVSYSVICENCNIEVFCRRTKEETIEAWNKRATESEIRAKAIDEFAEKLKEKAELLDTLDYFNPSLVWAIKISVVDNLVKEMMER